MTQRAAIGYSTFFRHFDSLDHLLAVIYEAASADIVGFIQEHRDPRDLALASYRYIEQHLAQSRLFVRLPEDHPLRVKFDEGLAAAFMECYEARDPDQMPMDASVLIMIRGSFNLMRWYLDRVDEYTPEQMAEMNHEFIYGGYDRSPLVPRDDRP